MKALKAFVAPGIVILLLAAVTGGLTLYRGNHLSRLPMQGGQPYANVRLGDQTLRMLLDSGSGSTTVPSAAVPKEGRRKGWVMGASGVKKEMEWAPEAVFNVAGRRFRSDDLIARESGPSLLGVDFFKSFSVAFDGETDSFEIGPRGRSSDCPPGRRIPVEWHGKFAVVDAALNDAPISLIVDTGSRYALAVMAQGSYALRLPSDPASRREKMVSGATGWASLPIYREKSLSVGPARLEAPEMIVLSDLPLPHEINGILGAEALLKWNAVVDLGEGALCLRA